MTPQERETALNNYYAAERRAGADPLTANERMGEYARRLDAAAEQYERDLRVLRQVLERA